MPVIFPFFPSMITCHTCHAEHSYHPSIILTPLIVNVSYSSTAGTSPFAE